MTCAPDRVYVRACDAGFVDNEISRLDGEARFISANKAGRPGTVCLIGEVKESKVGAMLSL